MQFVSRAILLGCLVVGARADSSRLEAALAAEARHETQQALELFLAAAEAEADSAFLLQKIARQYSDSVSDTPDRDEQRRRAQQSLAYARRAVALAPDDPVNVLSVAIAYGKAALVSDTRTKIGYSRLVKEGAERALVLRPDYALAHHVLGRWHRELVGIGAPTRFFARLIYDGLPPASAEQAIEHLQRATELEPDDLLHVIELGFAYAAAGRAAEAETAWHRGLAMPNRNKDDPEAKHRARAALAELRR
ncbi:MAG TPA: hypothetical protein VHF69_05240 [Candidatus Synoicihabitans sp.]|nr:hypothetical protein [Candidatus Synoicihabitans sp.]